MQHRGVVNVMFTPDDDEKTVDFVTVYGRSKDGTRFVIAGVRYDGKGNRLGAPPESKPVEPVKSAAESPGSEIVSGAMLEGDKIPNAAELGI